MCHILIEIDLFRDIITIYQDFGIVPSIQQQQKTTTHFRSSLSQILTQRRWKLAPGHVINLVSKDQEAILWVARYVPLLITATLQIIMVAVVLWLLVAPEAVAGISCVLLICAIKALTGPILKRLRVKTTGLTDRRLSIVSDVICGIRLLKMNAWEWRFQDLVARIRRYSTVFPFSHHSVTVVSHYEPKFLDACPFAISEEGS